MAFAGPKNRVGPIGPPGKNGKDGKDGRDGIDGKNGKNGRDGRDGKDGITRVVREGSFSSGVESCLGFFSLVNKVQMGWVENIDFKCDQGSDMGKLSKPMPTDVNNFNLGVLDGLCN